MFGIFKKEETTKTADLSTVLNDRKISLEKHIPAPLSDKKVKVVFCIDKSGSMHQMYKSGEVQRLVERIFPVALRFDDDGKMESYSFNTTGSMHPDITIENISGYVNKYITANGCTNYRPVMSLISTMVTDDYRKTMPTYVIFITDGDNSDKEVTKDIMQFVSNQPIFWKFIGIGNERFEFLETLDDMEGRMIDNADFVKIPDISKISDDELYKLLMQEFSEWWINAENHGIINK